VFSPHHSGQGGFGIVGSPETVIKKLRHIKDRLGIGALLLEAQAGQMSHQTTMRSIEILGREVIPALKEP
jgi:alkanesulfonate monooxygenase SsuD/methylene tetrahydromethanopterin reductase-like flavin-dependent oxidoreductase (luciferase family)